MKRLSVSLPDELAELVNRESRRRYTSRAAVIRDALEDYFRRTDAVQRRVLRIAGLGRSGESIASRMEELLDEEAGSDEGLRRMKYGE